MERRRFLATTGAVAATAAAGCLGEDVDPPGSDDGTGDGNSDSGNGEEGSGDGGDDTGDLVDSDAIRFATTGDADWFEAVGETVGSVVVIDSEERTGPIWPHTDVDPDRREEVTDFLQETSFADSVLVYVASVGPTTCHDALTIDEVEFDDGTITASARVVESADDPDACAEALAFPSALQRATFSDDPATEATVTVVDGWDNEAVIAASADDPLSPAPDELDGYVRPAGDPDVVPEALVCEEADVERVANWVDDEDVVWGDVEDENGDPRFSLRVDSTDVALGEDVRITMTNVTDGRITTGNEHKYAIERYTEAGWEDVRVAPSGEPLVYTDEGIVHGPGGGFEWTIELTEDGLVEGHAYEGTLRVCPDPQPGRYRFVYMEPGVAVAFDVTED